MQPRRRACNFCDAFSLPVRRWWITPDWRCAPIPLSAGALGKLASAYAGATCPKVTAVTGKAYGAAFTLLGSRALGADRRWLCRMRWSA